jgi:hypothetical protein
MAAAGYPPKRQRDAAPPEDDAAITRNAYLPLSDPGIAPPCIVPPGIAPPDEPLVLLPPCVAIPFGLESEPPALNG